MEPLQRLSSLSLLQLRSLVDLEVDRFRIELLNTNSRYKDAANLNRFEHSVFSQCGEDGIIEEIFKRIGHTNRYFVEFGAGNGLQNCTASLLLQNWFGLWIESEPNNVQSITSKFNSLILRHSLTFRQHFVTAENIENIFSDADVPEEFDMLSIDIDGNDYWIWNAITNFHPRVIVCEYNGRFGPGIQWVMKYNPEHIWSGTSYYGASLKSLELLGKKKGYTLVGCSLSGVNAFFVRQDLVMDQFSKNSSSENHFEPQRHFLIREPVQPNDFGPFEN